LSTFLWQLGIQLESSQGAVDERAASVLVHESSGYPPPKWHWIFIPSCCIRDMGVNLCSLLPSIFQH